MLIPINFIIYFSLNSLVVLVFEYVYPFYEDSDFLYIFYKAAAYYVVFILVTFQNTCLAHCTATYYWNRDKKSVPPSAILTSEWVTLK